MNVWPKDNQAALVAFYGNPGTTNHDLVVWESANLVYVQSPWAMVFDFNNQPVTKGLRVHKRVAPALERILKDIWENVAGRSQDVIERLGMHLYGGAYNQRKITGGKRTSTHGFGAGIDWNTAKNQMGSKGTIDPRVRAAFEKEGAIWLVHDPMHVQFADSPRAMPRAVVAPSKPLAAPPKPTSTAAWVEAAIPVVMRWEGFRPSRYWDVKQWAIGYGQEASGFTATDVITEAQARQMLVKYLIELAGSIAPLITASVTGNQGAALLSFAYNLGKGNLSVSTLLKKVNKGDPTAADEFQKWVKAGGKTLPGLVKRRAAERELFLTP